MGEPNAGHDLLTEPLFTVATDDGPSRLSLSALLARLLAGPEVHGFPEVAPEQRGYWWRFLVRCAAKALHELGWTVDQAAAEPAAELAERLEVKLRELVPDGGWCLYQPDGAKPGFLQVPTPGGARPAAAGYSRRGVSLLTGAIGSKNHERKSESVRELAPEQAVYALIEYQTAAVYGGKGNYSSQLQGSKSGAGSGTPFMGAHIAASEPRTFQYDVRVLLSRWPETAQELRGEVWALWASPWTGTRADVLPSVQLDPAFIPLARLVRLEAPIDGLYSVVWFKSTEADRVADHTADDKGKGGGLLGDPFTPRVDDPTPKVRGTLAKGYDYTEVVQLLFGGEKGATPSPSVQALAERAPSAGADLSVVFEGVAYEQGKTLGFHRREVLLPAGVDRNAIAFLDEPRPLLEAHGRLLEHIAEVKKALRGAARIVLSGEPKPRPSDDKKAERPAALLEARVDGVYLDFLFTAATANQRESQSRWDRPLLEWLDQNAREVLREALAALPCSTNQRLEREVRAEAYLSGRLRKLRAEPDHPEEVTA